MSRSRVRCRQQRAVTIIDPRSIGGLVCWLRGDDVTDVGSGVISQFNDKSGNSKHGVATAGQRGTLVSSAYNSRPGVSISGGQRYKVTGLTFSTFTIFCVWKSSSTAGLIYEYKAPTLTSGFWRYAAAANSLYLVNSTITGKTRGFAGTDDTFRISCHDYDGTHAGHVDRTFSALDSLSNGGGTANPGSLTGLGSNDLWIGARSDGTFPVTGTLCEVMIYTPALNASDRAIVNTYLANRYTAKQISGTVELACFGDSQTGTTPGANGVDSYVYSNAENPSANRIYNGAVAGETIVQQQARMEAYANISTVPIVSLMCGLNDLAALNGSSQSTITSTVLSRIQAFFTSARALNPTGVRVLYTITPAKQRWLDLYDAATAAKVHAAWGDVNAAIAANSISYVDFVRTGPATLVDDGNGNIATSPTNYLLSDGYNLHWNNTARQNLYAADLRTVISLARSSL